jgi:uncharacterized protein YoaH (UPF0181 family)
VTIHRTATVAGLLALLAAAPAALRGQEAGGSVRAPLAAHGLPPQLIDAVGAVADRARAQDLPTTPLVDKALEGWAKRVSAARIVGVLEAYLGRMAEARTAIREAGMPAPTGEAIAAVTEAQLRGMTREQVVAVIRAGPGPAGVAPGLKVATALAAQGLAMPEAVRVVTQAIRRGSTVDQLLDLPSRMRALQAEGLAMTEIGRRMIQGAAGGAGMGGMGSGVESARPGGAVPPPPPGGARSPGPKPPGGGRGPG